MAQAPRSGAGNNRRLLIIGGSIGAVLIVACCGGLGFMAYFGNKLEKTTRAEAVEADAAWEKGDKAGAAAKYRRIAEDHRVRFLNDGDRPRVYGRAIDFEYDRGDVAAGKALLDRAEKDGVVPAVSHADAVAAVTAIQAEKARVEAAKAEKQRVAAAKAKEPPKDSQNDTRFELSKGFGKGSMVIEVSPEVRDEITVSEFSFDGSGATINFKLHWKGSTGGRTRDPWHYSAFDKDGTKLDGSAVGIPGSMELGQKAKVRIVLRREDLREISRVEIHQ